ncbi:PD-(D/E)XK nuclease family protein [Methanohalobium sp.]|uniref:PD-(D/E)XK nuclease family protein n=1 Tax=Methanohalobium sp. TaxID=2837493 RepID=UPI00397E04F3
MEIINSTKITWKHAAYLLENITNCWVETGNIYEILKYDGFDSSETRQIIDILESGTNPYNAIEQYNIDENLNIAVVGLHQFTGLDRKVLPDKYDEIPVFSDSIKQLPKFCVFNSATEIIQTVIENIKNNHLLDIAVVLEPGSSYQSLLESDLKINGIPYMTTTDFSEDEYLRTFLQILRTGLYRRGLRVRDVKPILAHFDIHLSSRYDMWKIDVMNHPDITWLKEFLNTVPGSTFKEILEEYERYIDKKQEYLKQILHELGILTIPITPEAVNSIEYYLDTFDNPVDQSGRGVMLVSPKSSTYIDRPIVFYLGMDSSWTPESPDKLWVNEKEFDEKNKQNFQILLQNGEDQYFLVQDTIMAEKVTPCFYFNEFSDEEISSFTDFPHEFYGFKGPEKQNPFQKQDTNVDTKPVKTLSQSNLNIFAYCPKDYFFSQLVDGEDTRYTINGSLLHDFAEFYVNHPDFVDSNCTDEFVDIMVNRTQPYLDDLELDVARTVFRVGIENIRSYLQTYDYEIKKLDGYTKNDDQNTFSNHFNKDLGFNLTEMYFNNPELGGKGKVDLIRSPTHLVDHKTGKKRSIGDIMKKSSTENIESRPDFQPKMYLSHHRYVCPDRKLKFTYHHLLNNLKEVIFGNGSYDDNVVDIFYYPYSFDDLISDREIYDILIDGISETNPSRKILESMGYDNYHWFFQNKILPSYDKNELLESELCSEFVAFAKGLIGDYKYVENGCKSALKKMLQFREISYFKDDLDEFETFLKEQIERLNEYKETRFPVGDVDPEQIQHKDMVIKWE